MSASATALLIVDVQESFRHRPYWSSADVGVFVERMQALIDGAKSRNIPIVRLLLLDVAGPLEVLRRANQVQTAVRFDAHYVGPSASLQTSIGMRAGLLDGHACTTHHSCCAELAALAPKATSTNRASRA